MNRIILIGNGFDLAHGMKTKYNDFLNNYWEVVISKIKESQMNRPFENEEFSLNKCPSGFVSGNTHKDLEEALRNFKTTIKYKNRFLEIITDKTYIDKWVDVENEYYSLLKKAFDKGKYPRNKYSVQELNADFENIKNKLGKYLQQVEKEFNQDLGIDFLRTKGVIGQKIYRPFKLKDFSESSLNQKAELEYNLIKKDIDALKEGQISNDDLNEKEQKLIQRINTTNPLASIKNLLQSDYVTDYFDLMPDNILFLNFNYTFSDRIYRNIRDFDQFYDGKTISTTSINIHGTTDSQDKNDIIFGFGDELDDEYKSIEKLNDNAYLENIKSINYLKTDNYKKLLEFINSGNFQLFIFGHSCGISDRTMLNTIFEHDNCASIKVFYHKKEDETDNYSDVIRNISRNFNDKAKMRDRVVNKNYCEPLI